MRRFPAWTIGPLPRGCARRSMARLRCIVLLQAFLLIFSSASPRCNRSSATKGRLTMRLHALFRMRGRVRQIAPRIIPCRQLTGDSGVRLEPWRRRDSGGSGLHGELTRSASKRGWRLSSAFLPAGTTKLSCRRRTRVSLPALAPSAKAFRARTGSICGRRTGCIAPLRAWAHLPPRANGTLLPA